jgi:putative copper resistance protein D
VSLFLDIYGLLSVVLQGLLLTGQSLTLGGIAFLILCALPLAGELGADGEKTVRRCLRLTQGSAIAVAAVAVLGVAAQAAILADTLDLPIGETVTAAFGPAGLAQAALALAIVLLCRRSAGQALVPRFRAPKGRGDSVGTPCVSSQDVGTSKRTLLGPLALGLAGLALLASATVNSHAVAALEDRSLLTAATALHRLCAGGWIGGIPYFLIALAGSGADWRRIGRRFSFLSMAAVAAVAASGTVMSLSYIGSLEALYGTVYGLMVTGKLVLFAGLLGLGGMNALAVRRRSADPGAALLRLRRFAEAEIGVGITVLFMAASITSLPPAADLTQDRVTLAEYAQRLTPKWPSFSTPAQASLAIARMQAWVDLEVSPTAAATTHYTPGAGRPMPRNAANIAWSEFNHHWAGAFVLIMAMLTLADRNERKRWAQHWPLLFLPMAAFLAYRDLVEGGLYNGIGFFALLREPEIVQHLFFYALMAAFGLFETGVRTGRIAAPRAALAFPLLTATAAAALLTHVHSIGDAKELLLLEASHLPLAVLGIVFAWSRWLELRLAPAEGAAIAGSVWRASFLLVGLLLLFYREI